MKAKYTALFNVGVKHPFYENGTCASYTTTPVPDMVVVPSAETLTLMRRLDFIFRTADNTGGFTVLAATNGKIGPDDLLRFAPKATEKLVFFLVLRNAAMLGFNALPASIAGSIFYFTNQISGDPAPRTNLHLSQSVDGVKATNDLLSRSSSTYRYHHSTPVVPGTVEVKHILTGALVTPVSLQNTATTCDLLFNLAALPLGKCELWIGGTRISAFYHTGDAVPPDTYGVVELSLADTLDANYRIIETNDTLLAPTPLYFISFINRLTTWRYTIKMTPSSPLFIEIGKLALADKPDFMAKLKIVANNPAITFTQSVPDDKTIVFVSDAPIALKERYTVPPAGDTLKLTLTKYKGVPLKEAAVKENLSYPVAGLIDTRNPLIIYSDIFLTL